MANIVMLDRNAISSDTQIRALATEHRWTNFASSKPNQVAARLADADVAVLSKVNINETILDACPKLKHIAVAATGYNAVDIQACQQRNISVSNIPSYAATTVSEHVIGCTLVLRRQLQQYRQKVIDGAWQKSDSFCLFDKPINDLNGATMGIIGLGEIGLATAKLAKMMGMKVNFVARRLTDCNFAEQVSLDKLIATSDVISIHCSLNTDSLNLIGEQQLSDMQNHTILINTARGGIVDEVALVKAIQSQQIGGAAFDVLVEEPPKNHSPLLSIAQYNNVIITPHIAWVSQQAMQNLANILVDNVENFLNSTPSNLVSQ